MPHRTQQQPATGVAIIGCGHWGMNYVRVISELADAELLVVCDTRPDRLAQVSERFPNIRVTSEIEQALEAPGVDAAIVATQAEAHYEHVRKCLLWGKHVLVEKPLTTSSSDAEELVELAAETERVLLVGHTFLYNAGLRIVKERMSGPDLGQVYYLYSRRTNLGPIRQDVNAFWDLASHDVAIFDYLLGSRPLWVSAIAARVLRSEREDVSFISLGYEDGLVAHIHVSWAEPHKVREVVVVGSDQRIAFNDLDPLEQVRVYDKGVGPAEKLEPGGFGNHRFRVRDGAIISPLVPVIEPLKMQSGHFLHCIRRGEKPLTGGRLRRDVVLVMEAVDESVANMSSPIALPAEEHRTEKPRHARAVR